MEEDTGSWFGHQHFNCQLPNLGILNAHMGQEKANPMYMKHCSNFISANGILPMHRSSGVPHAKASQLFEPRGWSYCLPRFHQAFAPVLNSVRNEKFSASQNETCGGVVASDIGFGNPQKRFLVFDQSGNETTLIFSSGVDACINCMPSWLPKRSHAFTLDKEEPGTKRDASNPSEQIASNPFESISHDVFSEQAYKDDVQGEMHEDTEELDALLYSDDENDYSEDEEASTGHSPIPTAYDKRKWLEESGEEVDSSVKQPKRQKISEVYIGPSLMDTESSVKINSCSAHEDVAESSFGNSKNIVGESGFSSCNGSSRKEKIRKTISILESIIPDGKGKDAILVIDEAIHYLRSLKDKAKAFGLDDQ